MSTIATLAAAIANVAHMQWGPPEDIGNGDCAVYLTNGAFGIMAGETEDWRGRRVTFTASHAVGGEVSSNSTHDDPADAVRECERLQTQINDLAAAIETATNSWTGADWTHERIADGVPVRDDDGAPVHCEGGNIDGCELCARAKADAEEAAEHGRAALAALHPDEGYAIDWNEVSSSVNAAVNLEREHGDAPTWSRVAAFARAAM